VKKTIIFTDLDGTLLHPKNYSFTDALPALELIRERGIPLVLCSSKTRAELILQRKRLKNADPFVAENGGAVYVPRGYFSFLGAGDGEEYHVTSFGKPYEEVRKAFVSLREKLRVPVKGFGDMSEEEIAALTGLPLEEAAPARQRDFGEPFVFEGTVDEKFLKAIEQEGLHWTRGRLFYVMGDHDKGKAIRLLKQRYETEHGKLNTIGLGDALNDLPLLREVDHPVLVQKEDGSYDRNIELPRLIRAEGIGPRGWNRAIMRLLAG
jgi:mannosyl-3-phosphoglycerate phosphatase family protein